MIDLDELERLAEQVDALRLMPDMVAVHCDDLAALVRAVRVALYYRVQHGPCALDHALAPFREPA